MRPQSLPIDSMVMACSGATLALFAILQAAGPSAGREVPPSPETQPAPAHPLAAHQPYQPGAPPAAADLGLASELHQSLHTTMRAGSLAFVRGGSGVVRRLGDRLLRDALVADRQLLRWARVRAARLPEAPRDERDANQALLDRLRVAGRSDFDRSFLAMARDQENHLLMRTALPQTIQDPELRQLVGRLLPLLREHLQLFADLLGRERRAG
jgi:predicted outer membrane protein